MDAILDSMVNNMAAYQSTVFLVAAVMLFVGIKLRNKVSS